MVSFDVILTQKAGSDRTVKEVFFIVELSSKPKSFGVSIKKYNRSLLRASCLERNQRIVKKTRMWWLKLLKNLS